MLSKAFQILLNESNPQSPGKLKKYACVHSVHRALIALEWFPFIWVEGMYGGWKVLIIYN